MSTWLTLSISDDPCNSSFAELSQRVSRIKNKTKVCVKEENEKKFTVYDVNDGSSDELNLPYHYDSGFLSGSLISPDHLRY